MPTIKKKKTTRRNGTARSATRKCVRAETSSARRGPLAAAQKLVARTKRQGGQGLNDSQRERLLGDCEGLIGKHLEGFVAVGIALRVIRDEKLFEGLRYKTFQAYCRERWGFQRARASQLISAAGVAEAVYNCKQIDRLPANEAQVRPLVNLEPKQQVAVWKGAVKKAGNDKPITAKMVEQEAAKVAAKGKPQADRGAAAGAEENAGVEENVGVEENAGAEESVADWRKRFKKHCAALEKLDGERLSKKQKALRGALEVHGPKFVEDVRTRARRRAAELSKKGACRASGVEADLLAAGLLRKLQDALQDAEIADLFAPQAEGES